MTIDRVQSAVIVPNRSIAGITTKFRTIPISKARIATTTHKPLNGYSFLSPKRCKLAWQTIKIGQKNTRNIGNKKKMPNPYKAYSNSSYSVIFVGLTCSSSTAVLCLHSCFWLQPQGYQNSYEHTWHLIRSLHIRTSSWL